MPDVKVMNDLIEKYRVAQAALHWFANYDWEQKTRQIEVAINLTERGTDGAGEARAMLRSVTTDIATQLRDAAIVEAQRVVADFQAAMRAELAKP